MRWANNELLRNPALRLYLNVVNHKKTKEMSIERICPNCFQMENIRFNFGDNRQAEREFHSKKWCNCGYNSPNEMMEDQDMGFKDPYWIPIAKHFIENYHLRISQGHINNSEELVRFFLKLLKYSANNIGKSVELVQRKNGGGKEFIYEGKAKKAPSKTIFNDATFPSLNFPQQSAKQLIKNKSPKLNIRSNIICIGFWLTIGYLFGIILC